MAAVAPSISVPSPWSARVRCTLALVLVWAVLHFVVGRWAIPRGLDRPVVLSAAPLGGAVLVGCVWLGAGLAVLLVRARDIRRPLLVVGLALAVWVGESGRQGGTMDDWLIWRHESPGPPTSGPYWLLLPDYAFLFAALVGAGGIAAALTRAGQPQPGSPRVGLWRAAFGAAPDGPVADRSAPLTFLVTCAVAAAAIYLLSGPSVGATYRGQVYFSVLLGFYAAVFVARHLAKTRALLWLWPAPFVVGVIGLVVAAMWPDLALPTKYAHINTIPAWGLARALPIEMVSLGLVGTLWALRGDTARTSAAGSE